MWTWEVRVTMSRSELSVPCSAVMTSPEWVILGFWISVPPARVPSRLSPSTTQGSSWAGPGVAGAGPCSP